MIEEIRSAAERLLHGARAYRDGVHSQQGDVQSVADFVLTHPFGVLTPLKWEEYLLCRWRAWNGYYQLYSRDGVVTYAIGMQWRGAATLTEATDACNADYAAEEARKFEPIGVRSEVDVVHAGGEDPCTGA